MVTTYSYKELDELGKTGKRKGKTIEAHVIEPTDSELDNLRSQLDELGIPYSKQAKAETLQKKLDEALDGGE